MSQNPASTIIGITLGCPVGIGPEIILRFLASEGPAGEFQPVVVGDGPFLRQVAEELGLAVEVVEWQPGQAVQAGAVNVLSVRPALDRRQLRWGQPTRETGLAMAAYIETTVELIQDGVLAAMVTCPITKSALHLAGYTYPGHTEMLADLCHSPEYAMMMAGTKLRVTLVTIHTALSSVAGMITPQAVKRLLDLTAQSLRLDFGIKNPRLAVAALNPHAGEGGLFGEEESREILPAIAAARREGLEVSDPLPPDTVFNKAVAGEFDAVVCMYHDQGLIPFKLLHFEDGVNVTIGLPIVRTSVDHGTAYDIAGRGVASCRSLAAAFSLAAEIVINRRKV